MSLARTVSFSLWATTIAFVQAHNWETTSNGFPANTYGFDYYSKTYYFCQTLDYDGHARFGTLLSTENACSFANVEHNQVHSSDTFQVLTLGPGEVTSWIYSDTVVPNNAVPCQDIETNACHIGVSVYGDGICREAPGKIFNQTNMVHMQISQAVYKCPFHSYL
eukprot:maker-scaffold2905_size11406-snap-gene-0.2 protein:Tk05681 transcript:maker-scaffold2905_size11406-snap-gene-0.2-mRNA-1 annotation:"hypothetical protein LOTGIDRAFT_238094"